MLSRMTVYIIRRSVCNNARTFGRPQQKDSNPLGRKLLTL